MVLTYGPDQFKHVVGFKAKQKDLPPSLPMPLIHVEPPTRSTTAPSSLESLQYFKLLELAMKQPIGQRPIVKKQIYRHFDPMMSELFSTLSGSAWAVVLMCLQS